MCKFIILQQNSQCLWEYLLMKQMQKLKEKHWQQKQKDAEKQQENAQSNLNSYTLFYVVHLLNHYVLCFLKDSFLLHIFF